MKSWWREKDFAPILNEISITDEKDIQSNRGMCYCYTNIKSLPLELCVRCS